MEKSYLNLILLSCVFMLLLTSCGNEKIEESSNSNSQIEQQGSDVTPEVIFENDYSRVLKVVLSPGESQPAHDGENRVIYSLTDYSIDWKENGENIGTKTWKKGEAHYHESGKHTATNNGTTTAEWLIFAKKNTDLPECGENKIENDVSSVSAEFANVLIDNDEFKVIEVTLPVNAKIPMHSGVNRVIYSLSDYQIMYNSTKEGEIEKTFKSGDIHWHEACQHGLENLGQTEAKYLVVSYKEK